jgi:predicted PurR-regulated permease PerM
MKFERNIVFWVGALAVFCIVLWLLSPILLPFVLGLTVAYFLDPLNRRLVRLGISRSLAAFIILAVFVVAFIVLLLVILPPLFNQLAALVENAPGYADRIKALASDPKYPWLKYLAGDNAAPFDKSAGDLINQAVSYLTGFLNSLWSKGQSILSLFTLLVITPVVAFYLGCDWDQMLAGLDRLVPLRQRDTVHRLVHEIDTSISAYIRGQSGVCLILGSYYAVGLTLVGLDFGFLVGVISGFISFIPYVGSLTALVVSMFLAVAQFFPDWTHILKVAGIVLVGQFFEGNVLAPKLVGHSVGLHPVWLMFALVAFGYLFGFLGLLLAIPLAVIASVLIRFSIERYLASPFFTGQPTKTP